MSKNQNTDREVVYIDGKRGPQGECPVAVVYDQTVTAPDGDELTNLVVDPIFNEEVFGNLYGRILTLVEATTSKRKLKSVKSLFIKELNSWNRDVYASARELATNGDSEQNIFTRHSVKTEE